MTRAAQILPRARRYGETKRGPYQLRFDSEATGLRVTATGDGKQATALMSFRELDVGSVDGAVAKLCGVIERVLFEARDAARRKT